MSSKVASARKSFVTAHVVAPPGSSVFQPSFNAVSDGRTDAGGVLRCVPAKEIVPKGKTS